jgi:hypothetical protein
MPKPRSNDIESRSSPADDIDVSALGFRILFGLAYHLTGPETGPPRNPTSTAKLLAKCERHGLVRRKPCGGLEMTERWRQATIDAATAEGLMARSV